MTNKPRKFSAILAVSHCKLYSTNAQFVNCRLTLAVNYAILSEFVSALMGSGDWVITFPQAVSTFSSHIREQTYG